MHESTVTREILEISEKEAIKNRVSKVTCINLVLGKLRGFEPEPIRYYFEIFKKDYPHLKEADINIKEVDAIGYCTICKREFQIEDYFFICPDCGTTNVKIIQGNEFYIEALEVT